MRTFFALICSLALACAVSGQVSSTGGGGGGGVPAGAGARKTKGSQQIATQGGQAAGGHYIGLDHSLVNKSNVAKPPSGGSGVGKPTVTGKPKGKPAAGAGDERELMDTLAIAHRNSPAGTGKPTTVGKSDSFAKPTVSPRGYVGRNDGKVQQSTPYGNGKPVLNPIIFDPNGVPAGKPPPRNLTTNAKPSSEITANAAPPSFVGRSSGVAKQTGAGAHKTKGPQQIATQSGRSHIGRSDGYMQQVDLASSAGAGAQTTKKLKGSATNAAGGSPAVQLNRFSNTTFKPTTAGPPTTVGALGTSPAPKRVVWSHNAGSLSNRPMLNHDIQRPSGASQGQGSPAGGKKKGEKVSPPSGPR